MDYAFAPGTSPYEGYLRSMLQHRTSTTLISNKGLTSIADFLGQLVTQTVTGAGDLVPGSHAERRRQSLSRSRLDHDDAAGQLRNPRCREDQRHD